MKFSIIVPVYNAEKYLSECIASVLKQTYKNFEIVLINDGSVDGSDELCDSLHNQYPEKIKAVHQKNQGQLMSRYRGAKEASGDYCVFLDADDSLDSRCLEILNETINKYTGPDTVIYSFFYERDSERKKADFPFSDGSVYSAENKTDLYRVFLEKTTLNNVWTKAVKREILLQDNVGFGNYTMLRCSEDRLQVMEFITNSEKIVCIDKPLYNYKLVDGSVTRCFSVNDIEKFNIRPLCEVEEEYLCKWNMKTEKWQEKLEALFLNYAMYTYSNFYKNLSSTEDKKRLTEYDWKSFVKEEYLMRMEANTCVKGEYKKLWNYVLNKKHSLIDLHFIKKNAYSALKKSKRRFLG